MVERAPLKKQDEQYPLLKVDCGGGDNGGKPQVTTTSPTLAWGVHCSPKRAWVMRWPEYISACWMTLILIGISFIVFYGLGMEAYRRQPVLLIKCNGSNFAKDVFYHKIIQRGSSVPVMLHADYLSKMALKYPYLKFHVYFLVDDTIQSSYRVVGHQRFIKTFMPIPLSNTYPLYKVDESSRRNLVEFQNKFHNINITIMPLSKYMVQTPLKYKWRNIPLQYLSFYARVFSVWQNGGVGMDLNNFNNNFNDNELHLDRKVAVILKQHNDGIKPDEYTNALNKIDREEETEFLSLFCGLMHSIINETRSFLTNSFQSLPRLAPAPDKELTNKNEPLIRTHINKRDIAIATIDTNNITTITNPVFVNILNSSHADNLKKTEYQTMVATDIDINKTRNVEDKISANIENFVNLESFNRTGARYEMLNKSDHPQVVLFYDFSVFSDSVIPSIPDSFQGDANGALKDNKPVTYKNKGDTSLLSLDSEGTFIAVSSRLHPFLGQLLSAGCQRMHPKFAIQESYINQCVGIIEDAYCASIYLL